MTVRPEKDHGQEITIPPSSVLGFFDTKVQLDTFASELEQDGIHEDCILALYGDDGVAIVERVPLYFLGDGESLDMEMLTLELKQGHFGVAVQVEDRDEARRIASIGTRNGGRSFSYFGTLVHEKLTG